MWKERKTNLAIQVSIGLIGDSRIGEQSAFSILEFSTPKADCIYSQRKESEFQKMEARQSSHIGFSWSISCLNMFNHQLASGDWLRVTDALQSTTCLGVRFQCILFGDMLEAIWNYVWGSSFMLGWYSRHTNLKICLVEFFFFRVFYLCSHPDLIRFPPYVKPWNMGW